MSFFFFLRKNIDDGVTELTWEEDWFAREEQ